MYAEFVCMNFVDKQFCLQMLSICTNQDALGIDHVVEPTSSASLAAMFVVDSKILYEICSFGMNDVEEVSHIFCFFAYAF